MGASFRSKEEVLALAGCDKLTIAPAYLEEMAVCTDSFDRVLSPEIASYTGEKLDVTQAAFRFALNEDSMATEKLAEGIRSFSADMIKLENIIATKIH